MPPPAITASNAVQGVAPAWRSYPPDRWGRREITLPARAFGGYNSPIVRNADAAAGGANGARRAGQASLAAFEKRSLRVSVRSVLLWCGGAAVALATLAALYGYWPGGDTAPPCNYVAPDRGVAGDPADGSGGADLPFTPRPIDRLEAGTRIGDGPPSGFTHLIFKTHQKLDSGQIEALPSYARPLAEFLFTTMAARVVAKTTGGQTTYRLEQVAAGLGTQVGEDDLIITKQTHAQLGANLGFLKSLILDRAEERMALLQLMAATDTMTIIDVPTIFSTDDQHRTVILRYACLIDPATGGLATVVWRIDLGRREAYDGVVGQAILMEPNLISTSPLHVDGSRVTAGIPASDAIAVSRMPPGPRFDLPVSVAALAGGKELSRRTAEQLEAAIRAALLGTAGK